MHSSFGGPTKTCAGWLGMTQASLLFFKMFACVVLCSEGWMVCVCVYVPRTKKISSEACVILTKEWGEE